MVISAVGWWGRRAKRSPTGNGKAKKAATELHVTRIYGGYSTYEREFTRGGTVSHRRRRTGVSRLPGKRCKQTKKWINKGKTDEHNKQNVNKPSLLGWSDAPTSPPLTSAFLVRRFPVVLHKRSTSCRHRPAIPTRHHLTASHRSNITVSIRPRRVSEISESAGVAQITSSSASVPSFTITPGGGLKLSKVSEGVERRVI